MSFKNARLPSLEHSGPRLASSTQVERDARQAVACGSWLAGPRCGNAAWRPTQPASVGAGEQRSESSARVRGRNACWVCPRVAYRLQKSASGAKAHKKRDSRWQRGRVHGELAVADPKGSARVKRRRQPNVAVAKPRCRGRPEPDAREGVAGQRSLSDGRHSGSFLRALRSHGHSEMISATLTMTRGRASAMGMVREATGMSEVRPPRVTVGRKRPPRWHESETCGPPKPIALM